MSLEWMLWGAATVCLLLAYAWHRLFEEIGPP